VKNTVETPNDISGVVYVSMDDAGNWKEEIKTEMRGAGYSI
jgi:predicted nucleotide-binding protein